MKKTTLLLALTPLVCNLNVARRACLWALVLLSPLAFWLPPVQAAVTEAWVQRYNGPTNSDDYARGVAVDGSGKVCMTGNSATIKYRADGTGIWTNNAGGTALAMDNSGNVVVTGARTIKYLADGTGAWTNNAGGTALAVDGGGNVVVTGHSWNGTNTDFYTAKYAAANGMLLWEKGSNGAENPTDAGPAVAVDGSGNVVVTGSSWNTNSYADYYTAKYAAADGALLWEQTYNGPANSYDRAQAIAVDAGGNVVVTGYSINTNFYADYYTAKYAATNGALLWEQRYIGGYASAVAVDSSGNAVVTGTSNGGAGCENYYTAKYASANGALLWEKRYNGPANDSDIAYAVAVDRSDNVVVTGTTDFNDYGTNSDYYTAKYAAADGALLWEKRYNGPANGFDLPSGLVLGPDGMVAVTGSSSGDYATVVYWENLPAVSLALVSTGIRLRFTGIPGRSYTLERAPAVTGPWTSIHTQIAPASGALEYIDTTVPIGSGFYRTTQP
jgi:hypothetical protein